jgi:hypothetical protein
MTWGDWSATWGWVERASAYDTHVDRQKRIALEQEQVEASRRHARALQASIAATMMPVRIALEVATPAGLEMLRTAAQANATGLRVALAEARMAAAHLPALVASERLTLGMATERAEVQETPTVDPIAAQIVRDPALTKLASDLLDRIAHPADLD